MSLPGAIQRTPELDSWVRVDDDGYITIFTGKVEIGQGIKTAIAMIAAEELDVPVASIRIQTADTNITPNEFVTAGSMSVEDSGSAVRVASATARKILLARAAEVLGVTADSLVVEDGQVCIPGSDEQTSYWLLQGNRQFGVNIQTVPTLKNPDTYSTVGQPQQRSDLPDKVQGRAAFVHDMDLPNMRHGRLVKPSTLNARLTSCPEALDIIGVDVVRNGSFLGVIANSEADAILAAQRLAGRCVWTDAPIKPPPAEIPAFLRDNVTKSLPIVDGTPLDEVPPTHVVPAEAHKTLAASYSRPFQLHASIGPSAAVAQFDNNLLTVYSHSQGVELLKYTLAQVLTLAPEQVHVIHREGSGCYGHNGADDVSLDAALLAMAATPHPVSVKWTRADEHGFEPCSPASVIDMQASLDQAGNILDWCHEAYSFTHVSRPRPMPEHTNLQSAWWLDKPVPRPIPRPAMFQEVGIHRNLEPIYTFPQKHLVKHFVAESPLRTSAVRSLGAFANVFAIESFMDELALIAGAEPFEFRLRHLKDARARGVLELLQKHSPPAPSAQNTGRGVAIARYKNRQTWCAIAADVEVSDDAQVRLLHAVIAADAGLVIDPDGLTNQLEGGFIQAASWALKESVRWEPEGVTSLDWDSYPILKFSEVPTIETHLVHAPHEKALGAGEASTGPTPAAIANAIYAATGVRIRDIPFTAEQLRLAASS
ncbi:MAG: molybdopterin cofactor-binding domain-containing protein [Pseudomonadota bacterium]